MKPSMRDFWLQTIPRVLLGTLFLIGAIDGFAWVFTGAHLVHPPTSASGLALEAALKDSGFFWPFLKSVELAGALCLLSNRAPALGLALLAPIMAVVVLFHLVLNPGGVPLALVLIACGSLLLKAYAPRFGPLFAAGSTAR